MEKQRCCNAFTVIFEVKDIKCERYEMGKIGPIVSALGCIPATAQDTEWEREQPTAPARVETEHPLQVSPRCTSQELHAHPVFLTSGHVSLFHSLSLSVSIQPAEQDVTWFCIHTDFKNL